MDRAAAIIALDFLTAERLAHAGNRPEDRIGAGILADGADEGPVDLDLVKGKGTE